MSTDTVENVEQVAPETPKVDISQLSQVAQALFAQVTPWLEEHNSLAQKIVAASGNEDAIVEQLVKDETGPFAEDVKKIEKAKLLIFNLENELKAKASAHAKSMNKVDESEIKTMTDQATSLRKKIVDSRNLLGQIDGEEVVKAVFSQMPPLISHKTGKTGGTQGKGGRKIRGFDFFVDGKLATAPTTVTHTPVKGQPAVAMKDENGNNIVEQVSSARAVSKLLQVPNDATMAAFFQAQGSDDKDKWQPEVTFSMKDKDGNEHEVTAKSRPE